MEVRIFSPLLPSSKLTSPLAMDHPLNLRRQARLGGRRMDVRRVHEHAAKHHCGDFQRIGIRGFSMMSLRSERSLVWIRTE